VLQLVVSMLSKVMKDYEPGLIEFIESVWQQARSSPPWIDRPRRHFDR
jgi:hypothetical protein